MPQLMQNLEDSLNPTSAMNKALALIAKAFKVNTIPTNNNQRSLLIPYNNQIAQPDMNTSQDIKMQMVDDNDGNQSVTTVEERVIMPELHSKVKEMGCCLSSATAADCSRGRSRDLKHSRGI
ncbi:hypothetical protein Tco_0776807 [Tanacetum coccineum]